jgi:hypothetical protein
VAFGRPSIYSQELAATICERLIYGEGLRAICRDDDMPSISTVIDWIKNKDDFSAQYARARELQAELLLDEILEIADDSSKDMVDTGIGKVVDHEVIQRARLRVDTRKWAMGKMSRKFNDKIIQEHTGANGGSIQVNTTAMSAEEAYNLLINGGTIKTD